MQKTVPVTIYRDRQTGQHLEEKLFVGPALTFLYGDSWLSRWLGRYCCLLLARFPLFSAAVGWWYRRPGSRRLIAPFIANFDVDGAECAEPVESYPNFNAFFTRRLKEGARPLQGDGTTAVIPADGRYLFYQNLTAADGWVLKGKKFDLSTLVGDNALAERYHGGTMVIARLCPSDYHRFHFPCDCYAGEPKLLNGYLDSVHPLALRHNLSIFTQNKRYLSLLESDLFGTILYIEIGAIGVGSVVQSYQPDTAQLRGAEKGFFQFGASCLVLLFEPGRLLLDSDLTHHDNDPHIEIRCLMGQPLGYSYS